MKEQFEFFKAENNIPFSIFLYHDVMCDLHCHKFLELLYCTKGRYEVRVNGQSYECINGDFVIIHTMEPHLTKPLDAECMLLCVQIDLSVLDNVYGSFCESQFLLPFIRGKAEYHPYISTQRGTVLESILSELLLEYQKKDMGYELCIRGNLLRLFAYLIRSGYITINRNGLDSEDLEQIRPVIAFLEKGTKNDLSVSQAAQMACMSYYHFCRHFKKVTGKTFVEYQNFVRLRKAEALLLTTKMNITDIAYETGFGSAAYFNRIYKRETGQSPMSFRKQMKV